MADNVTLSAGTADGALIMTDQDASGPNAHAQIIKLAFGALNTFTLVTGASGLPVEIVASATLTVNSHAVTNAGTFAVQAAQSGTWNIGTVTALTAISNALPAGTNLLGVVSSPAETSTIYNGTTALTPKFAAIAAASSGDNTLVAAVSGKKIRVLSMFILAAGAVNVYFTSAAAGTVIFGGSTNKIQLSANGGFVLSFSPVGHMENSSANQALVMNLSGATVVSGGLTYIEV